MKSKLRIERERRGWSLSELALRAKLRPSNISLYERGLNPSQPVARRMALALGMEPVEIWPEFETFRGW